MHNKILLNTGRRWDKTEAEIKWGKCKKKAKSGGALMQDNVTYITTFTEADKQTVLTLWVIRTRALLYVGCLNATDKKEKRWKTNPFPLSTHTKTCASWVIMATTDIVTVWISGDPKQQWQKVIWPGLAPLSQPVLCAQIHAVGYILHRPQLEKQAKIQHRQNQQTERDRKLSLKLPLVCTTAKKRDTSLEETCQCQKWPNTTFR